MGSRAPAGSAAASCRHCVDALFLPVNQERAAGLLRVLREVADAHDAGFSQVALAWLIKSPAVVAIPARPASRSWRATWPPPRST